LKSAKSAAQNAQISAQQRQFNLLLAIVPLKKNIISDVNYIVCDENAVVHSFDFTPANNILKHGDRAKSIIKYGLDYIARILSNPFVKSEFDICKFLSYS